MFQPEGASLWRHSTSWATRFD